MNEPGRGDGGQEALPKTREKLLTEQFYRWEKRGRGWQVHDAPVKLEPPFTPFYFHYVPSGYVYDDARKPTLLSFVADRVKAFFAPTPPANPVLYLPEPEEPEPEVATEDLPVVEIGVALPPELAVSKERMEQLISGLTYLGHPLGFEIIGRSDVIEVQLACRELDLASVRQQLQAYFPEAILREQTGHLERFFDSIGNVETEVIDFGLFQEFMRPLRLFRNFDIDPLIGVTAALANLQAGEVGLLQILFQPARSPWPENILRSVTNWEGGHFFVDAPEMVSQAKQKISRPLYATIVRVAAQSRLSGRAWQVAKDLGSALMAWADPTSNELIPLTNDDYDPFDHAEDVVNRCGRRTGMLLNSDELVSLVHLPSSSVQAEKLKRETERTRAAPALALGHRLVLGDNAHAGKTSRVTLSAVQRTRHMYLIGASGTGKSTLLLNMIVQDIQNGDGLAVLDPHGDLIDQILARIPEGRHKDVILFDPSDAEYPVGFNILSATSEVEKNVLASDMVSAFKRLSTSWGDQMTSVLGNAVLACVERKEPATLLDLRHFLIDPGFRRSFLTSVQDPEVLYYWEKEFPLLSGRPQASILTRLDTFLRPRLIRNIVSQKENRLNFRAIMDEGKIFLAKLAQGIIGEENSYLLGTLIVSKLHQVAMGRQEQSEAERRAFYLYVDEFHNFVTPSMASMLSGARKFGLGLVLAHQELRQLWNRDSDVASAVISNPYTRICFRLGDFDAHKLADGFSHFEVRDLQNLGVGEAICRVERSEFDFNLKTPPLPSVEVAVAKSRREGLLQLSRQTYGSRRQDVEAEMETLRGAYPALPEVHAVRTKPVATMTKTPPANPIAVPVCKEATRQKQAEKAEDTPLLGRGGQDHKNLQQYFKQLAESKGYLATIEKQVLEGAGFVDLALEKDNEGIAVEFCVTSTVEQELGNVQKCLAANFDAVIVVSVEKINLGKIKALVTSSLDFEASQKVQFFLADELVSFLERTEAVGQSEERIVRGRKVKTNYRFVSGAEQAAKKESVLMALYHKSKRLITGK